MYTIDAERRQATNVYVWDTAEAAHGFFSDEMRQKIAAIYAADPTVAFAEVARRS